MTITEAGEQPVPARSSIDQTMADDGLYEIRITTGEAGAILRAATERAVAAKAETLIRRAHSRGAAIGVAVTGSDGQAVRRLELYLADVVSDVERS
ncbi:hypothetical protein LRS73_03995 [Methylobacterium currus]|nr:hypothetical protein [Methylobacterium currus]UHC17086.1 hypothetical protein LRS73_03995 [Methylobacterium currus]